MKLNINDFIQQRICKDITAEVEVSPSPYDIEAYAEWKRKRQKERDKKLPMIVDKKDKIKY